jgi:hypothetical protein
MADNISEDVVVIEYAGGYEAARIVKQSDGSAIVEIASPADEHGHLDWKEPVQVGTFPTPREAALWVLTNKCGW